ncbi:hypothetical protein HanPSC8_Chr01g0008211 [Helianthus annuus]|nr:hypothetical protein HanPSC8_Chr01g0008211 [Helianthus annuus]
MLLRNSPHKDPEKNSPLKGQGIIKDSPTERCCFTDPQVDRIRHCFPANTIFKSFTPTALSDFISDTWVAFPVTPFLIGYSYPFPQFTQSFFSLTGICYIQAMPMIWRLTPAAKERLLAFKKLDPEIRTFQVATQDSQEVSSASVTMSSAGKSAKSASKFGIDDLANVKSARKKTPAASPTASAHKAPIRGKGKKRKASEDLQGFPLLRQQFLDYVNEVRITAPACISCLFEDRLVLNLPFPFLQKLAEIETYIGHVEDQDRQIADLQQMGVLKDLKIADLEKELRATKDKAARMLINFDYEKHDITQDAKVSAAITMYKIQLQMVAEAQDPSFNKGTWDVEGWKARLAELEDDEEIPMLEGGDAGKDQGEASGAGGDGAAKV